MSRTRPLLHQSEFKNMKPLRCGAAGIVASASWCSSRCGWKPGTAKTQVPHLGVVVPNCGVCAAGGQEKISFSHIHIWGHLGQVAELKCYSQPSLAPAGSEISIRGACVGPLRGSFEEPQGTDAETMESLDDKCRNRQTTCRSRLQMIRSVARNNHFFFSGEFLLTEDMTRSRF